MGQNEALQPYINRSSFQWKRFLGITFHVTPEEKPIACQLLRQW